MVRFTVYYWDMNGTDFDAQGWRYGRRISCSPTRVESIATIVQLAPSRRCNTARVLWRTNQLGLCAQCKRKLDGNRLNRDEDTPLHRRLKDDLFLREERSR